MTETIEYSLGELARLLNVNYSGNPDDKLTGLATLASAQSGDLSFYHNTLYYRDLLSTCASAVIVHPDQAGKCPCNTLLSEMPYITFAHASRLFEQRHKEQSGIHPSAIIDQSAHIAASAVIGAQVTIAENARIGENVHIGPGCHIGANARIGVDTRLYANVCLYPGVKLGARNIIHAQVVIGSDGFGFAYDGSQHIKIAQLGCVRIGDDVEIGAGSTIDRGALDDTVIEDGVKIDNQVQIAHNVRVGANTVICGCSAIAGSTSIGKNCTIAGGVGIINHLTIVDGVTVTAMSLVSQSIKKKGVYSSGTGLSDTPTWRKNMVRFKQLDEISKRLRDLEKQAVPKKG